MSEFRVYGSEECGKDGYPFAWHETLKHFVREQAGHRCVRCGHPYEKGMGEWSPCDDLCAHPYLDIEAQERDESGTWHALWRILTVHHLNGVKADCRWWNLIAACQRCHLNIQRRVEMDRPWPWPHSGWFKPYVAGFYAAKFLGEELTREETEARMDELLELGAAESSIERMPL